MRNHVNLFYIQIPTTSTLNYPTIVPEGQVRYPLVSVKNVYIFPGIPTLLQRAFMRMKNDLFKSDFRSYVREVFVTKSEIQFADILNKFVTKYKDEATFGSYPKWDVQNYYQTKLTIESESEDLVNQIAKEMSEQLSVIEIDQKPYDDILEKINKLVQESKVSFANVECAMVINFRKQIIMKQQQISLFMDLANINLRDQKLET